MARKPTFLESLRDGLITVLLILLLLAIVLRLYGCEWRPLNNTAVAQTMPPVSQPRAPVTGGVVPPAPVVSNALRLLAAIEQVESGGDCQAVGDGGSSRGPLQCGRMAWADALVYGAKADDPNWSYLTSVWDREKSRKVFLWYTARWGAQTPEERARCWNSGPKWREKYHLTNGYWNRVCEEMEK